MARYKIAGDGIKDTETGAFIPKDPCNRHYCEYLYWCAGLDMEDESVDVDPREPDPEFSEAELVDQARQTEIARIVSAYEAAIAQPVECLADGKTYFMDGREESAVKMKHGIELAELTGADSMDIVDYYNRVHEGVALAHCYGIMLQQAAAYLYNWTRKSKERSVVLGS